MTYLWIWVTIGAALSQTVRSTYQKKLKAPLGDLGASYVRFSYAIPFAWAWVFIYGTWSGEPLPGLNIPFLLWTIVAGVTQIIFTVLLVTLFSHRSFAAGTASARQSPPANCRAVGVCANHCAVGVEARIQRVRQTKAAHGPPATIAGRTWVAAAAHRS